MVMLQTGVSIQPENVPNSCCSVHERTLKCHRVAFSSSEHDGIRISGSPAVYLKKWNLFCCKREIPSNSLTLNQVLAFLVHATAFNLFQS